jgi:gliding motility-associated-like protein
LLFLFFLLQAKSQVIQLHSITTKRQPSGDRGYTLDGMYMATTSRIKLLNPAHFGVSGVYPKAINIYDGYGEYGSFGGITKVPTSTMLFFGGFVRGGPGNGGFSDTEIDSLYEWSLRGGKIIIASGQNNSTYDGSVLNAKWKFVWGQGAPGSWISSTMEGFGTELFNGPFGSPLEIRQAMGLQGYFLTLPPSHVVLGTDGSGKPALFMDCATLDLVIADVDVYTSFGGVSVGDNIKNDQDRFWLNTIAFMDKLQSPPVLKEQENAISVDPVYKNYQWYYNSGAVAGATTNAMIPSESGTYQVEVTVNGGCKVRSDVYITPDIDPAFNCDLFVPEAFSPDGNGVNESVCILGTCAKEIDFRIYDRWGENIFHSDNVRNCWDGTYKGAALNSGVFAWTLSATSLSGKKINKKGNLTLVR